MRCNAGDYPESPAALHCSASPVQHSSSRSHVIPLNTPGQLTSSVLHSRHGYFRPLVASAGAQSRAEHSTESFGEQKQPLHVASANILSSGLVPHLEALVASSGALGPVVFALAYGLATAAFLPAAPLSIASGYLFGPLLGIPVASVASVIGCALSFTVSRYIARSLLEPHLKAYPDFVRIDRAIAHRAPGKVVFLLRLSPIIPLYPAQLHPRADEHHLLALFGRILGRPAAHHSSVCAAGGCIQGRAAAGFGRTLRGHEDCHGLRGHSGHVCSHQAHPKHCWRCTGQR